MVTGNKPQSERVVEVELWSSLNRWLQLRLVDRRQLANIAFLHGLWLDAVVQSSHVDANDDPVTSESVWLCLINLSFLLFFTFFSAPFVYQTDCDEYTFLVMFFVCLLWYDFVVSLFCYRGMRKNGDGGSLVFTVKGRVMMEGCWRKSIHRRMKKWEDRFMCVRVAWSFIKWRYVTGVFSCEWGSFLC